MNTHWTLGDRQSSPGTNENGSGDNGASLVEMLVAITLMGTVVLAVISSVFVTVKATAYERDHAKAQQWLQAAVGVIEAVQFSECNPALINGASVQKDYQDAVTIGKVDTNRDGVINSEDGAKRPWQYDGTLTVGVPDVWDGDKFVPFGTQSVCYDQSRLRQQRVKLMVNHPNGVNESVEMIKVDR